MDEQVKDTIDQLAQALQIVTLLSTQLRRELADSAEEAVQLEAAADRAARALKTLLPPGDRRTRETSE